MGQAPSDEEIVKYAYCMAVGEQRYGELFTSLRDRVADLVGADATPALDAAGEEQVPPELQALEAHFDNAHSLLANSGRRRGSAAFSLKAIDSNDAPAALIDDEGRVIHANAPAASILGFEKDAFLTEDAFEPGQLRNLLGNLAKIEQFPANTVISLFGAYSLRSDDLLHLALTRVDQISGATVGYLTAAKINWVPEQSDYFQSLFKLTPTEMEITKALVNGNSLTQIAQQRGRSIGTVRQQAKQLLAKLDLRSQTELVCLYSGIVKYDGSALSEAASEFDTAQTAARVKSFELHDGRGVLEYEIAGDPADRPMLFLPALLGGTALTETMRQSLRDNRIKLIMPWRPGMGNSPIPPRASLDEITDHARDIEQLLDHLNIAQLPVIGNITSAMFAYGLGTSLPGRISAVANINGIVPINSGGHVKMLDPSERLRFYVHQHLPKVAKMMTRSMLNVVDSGQDMEFLEVMLNKNPHDLVTITDAEIMETFRDAHDFITLTGFDAFSHEISLAALDWQHLIEQLPCPLLNVVSDGNLSFTPRLLRVFEQEKRVDLNMEVIEQAGHLALYQRTEAIFAKIAAFAG
ncbi:MAG: LuxR C-terminal-related transcriptional regulator [Marinomonas sp.]